MVVKEWRGVAAVWDALINGDFFIVEGIWLKKYPARRGWDRSWIWWCWRHIAGDSWIPLERCLVPWRAVGCCCFTRHHWTLGGRNGWVPGGASSWTAFAMTRGLQNWSLCVGRRMVNLNCKGSWMLWIRLKLTLTGIRWCRIRSKQPCSKLFWKSGHPGLCWFLDDGGEASLRCLEWLQQFFRKKAVESLWPHPQRTWAVGSLLYPLVISEFAMENHHFDR